MAAQRGRRIALAVGILALVAVVAGLVASWGRLREEWYLWRLASEDQAVRFQAADSLATLQSVRAVRELIRLAMQKDACRLIVPVYFDPVRRKPVDPFNLTPVSVSMDPLTHAIYRIERPALPALSRAQSDHYRVAGIIEMIESPHLRGIQADRLMEKWKRPRPRSPGALVWVRRRGARSRWAVSALPNHARALSLQDQGGPRLSAKSRTESEGRHAEGNGWLMCP